MTEAWTYWHKTSGEPKPEEGTYKELQYWNQPEGHPGLWAYCYTINDSGLLYRFIATNTRQSGAEEQK